jgi:RND superfamily putative drug exporter
MDGLFVAWGRFVHRARWAVLGSSALLLAVSMLGLLHGGTLAAAGNAQGDFEAARASDLIKTEVPTLQVATSPTVTLVFRSDTLSVMDAGYQSALDSAIEPLRHDSRVTQIVTPYTVPPASRAGLISRDGHEALSLVTLRGSIDDAQGYYPEVRKQIKSSVLSIQATGSVPIPRAFNDTLETDLQRAELVSLPISLILLLVIFGSVVAALMPLMVGVLTILGGLGCTLLLARVTDVSSYALNVVTLIGLGVSIDYSLFIVNRFREELSAATSHEDALANTVATAGRAVTFSGLTVAIGLSALLFYQGTFLAAMGAAGAIVVGIAVLYSLTLLPALLAILGSRVDRLQVPMMGSAGRASRGFWHQLAIQVMRRPLRVLLPALALLLLAGAPFLGLRLSMGDVSLLPARLEARQADERVLRDFPGQDQTSFTVVVQYPEGDPLAADHVQQLYELSRRIATIPGIIRVTGPVDLRPGLTIADYQHLYGQPPARLPPDAAQVVRTSVGSHIVILTALSNRSRTSDAAHDVLQRIRAEHVQHGRILVTGDVAFDSDTIALILDRTRIAFGFITLVTLAVMLLVTRSPVLSVTTVLTNLLSISASFGALVWVFQQGHLSAQLDFTPQPINPNVAVILFAAVFGLSMDYEVLLVSRIQEEYRRTHNNPWAVAAGLARSGRLITGAAAIMVAVFLSFGLAEVVLIKAIGIGLAIAVALDSTVVRGLVVPSVMGLLDEANWWSPRLFRRRRLTGVRAPERRGIPTRW